MQKLCFPFQINLDLGGLNRNISSLYSFLIPKYRHSIFKCFFSIFPKWFKLHVRNASGEMKQFTQKYWQKLAKRKPCCHGSVFGAFFPLCSSLAHLLTKVYPCSHWLSLTLSLHQCSPHLG